MWSIASLMCPEYSAYSYSNIILNINVINSSMSILINLNKLSFFSEIVSWIELNENDIDIRKYISIISKYLKNYLVMKYVMFFEYISDLKKCLPDIVSFSTLQHKIFAGVDYDKLYGISIEKINNIKLIPHIYLEPIKLNYSQKLGGYSKIKKIKLNAKIMGMKKSTAEINYEYYIETPYLIGNKIGRIL